MVIGGAPSALASPLAVLAIKAPPIDPEPVRFPLIAILLGAGLLAGCPRSEDEPPGALGSGPPAGSPSAVATWSRDAVSASKTPGGAASALDAPHASADPAVVTSVDPTAVDELLAAVPKTLPASTDPDGGTLIGTDTGEREDSRRSARREPADPEPAKAPREPQKKSLVSLGAVSIQESMANPSLERAARAELYWPLVQRCRDKEGKILPPDAILVLFHINVDGYIIGSSIVASPSKPIYEDAAHCMRRELLSATFRAPPAARGMQVNVTMTVPSVD